MKQVHANYTFNAATKTITLTGLNIDQDQLLLITNVKRGVVYYNFASSLLRATVTPGTNTIVVLTDASTTGHEDSDQLVVHYEDQINSSYTINSGENYQAGTITLTNNTAAEISYGGNGVNGFSTVVLEITTSGVTWGTNNLVAQAHNQTGVPTDQQIMCPLGVRINHSSDSGTGLSQAWAGTVGYVNLEQNISTAGYFGTRLYGYEYNNASQLSSLPATGTRFFIFDLAASRFYLKGNFTAGTVTVNYRLYRTRHPVFSARRVVVSGELSDGGVRVGGDVNASVTGSVYLDGGYLDDTGSIYSAAFDALNDYGAMNRGSSGVVTVSSFTSTASNQLKAANGSRKLLSVFNEGAGNLYILYGTGTASTTNYSVKLSTGDYLEVDKYTGQLTAIFATAGTARVTEIT